MLSLSQSVALAVVLVLLYLWLKKPQVVQKYITCVSANGEQLWVLPLSSDPAIARGDIGVAPVKLNPTAFSDTIMFNRV